MENTYLQPNIKLNRPRRPKSYANGSRRPLSTDSEGSEFPESTAPLCLALIDFVAQYNGDLSFRKGDIIKVLDSEVNEKSWCTGEINGKTGVFPSNHTRIISRKDVIVRYKANEIVTPDPRGLEYSRLGFGATATVYRVQVVPSGRTGIGRFMKLYDKQGFALKKFNESFGQQKFGTYSRRTAVEKLQKEARLLNELSHENIVEFLGYCADTQFFGLLLELCQDGSLRKLCLCIPKEQAMPLEILVNWALQTASGMKYLTEKGYIHRDLKTENVLVKQVGCVCDVDAIHCTKCKVVGLSRLQLKIADFGVTRKVDSTGEMTFVGTLSYLSPEAFRSQKYSEASDVWSFGVVLWEILTREVPFEGADQRCVAFNVARAGNQLKIPPQCPEKWKCIMELCWRFEAKDRPKFSDLVVILEDYRDEIRDKKILITPFSLSHSKLKEREQGCDSRKEYSKLLNSYNFLNERRSTKPPELPERSEIKRETVILRKSTRERKTRNRSRAKSCGIVLDRSRKVPEVFEDVPKIQETPDEKITCAVDSAVSSPGRSNFFVPLSNPFVVNRFYCNLDSDEQLTKEQYQLFAIKDSMTQMTYSVRVPKHYTDLKFVENSAQGLVFSSVDNKLGKRVLITRVNWYDGEKSNLNLLYKEITVLTESDHPCIARLLNIFTPPSDNKATYLVTEHLDTLRSALENGRISSSVDHRNLSYFLYQMLSGIQYLHDSGVIHQNLTKSCLMVDHENQTLQIRSFPTDCTNSCLDEAITEELDIWSIACVFLEVYTHSDGKVREDLTGVTSLLKVLRMHPHEEYSRKDMTELHACDLLFKMLKIDPKERISAEDALKHPYVISWVNKKMKKAMKIQWRLETDNKTRKEIEELFLRKLKQYKYKLEGGTILEL